MSGPAEMMRRQRVLAEFGDFVLDHEDLDEILNEGCRLIAEALGADLAAALEIERERDTALVRAGVGWRPGIVGRERVSLSEQSSEAYAVERAEPVITNDIAREDRFAFPAFLKEAGVVALVNVPIFLPGRRPWGVLQVDARETRNFDQEDIEFLKTYSMVLGPVIDRLRVAAEREQARSGLAQREERLNRVLSGMGEGFGLLAPDFTILEHNREALRLDGRPRHEVVGRSHWEVYPGSEHSELGRLLKKAMAERVPVFLEHQYAFREGRARWLEMHAYPTEDGALAVFWRDVSDQKSADAAMREGEARRRLLQAGWETDASGVVTADSPSWRAYTGQTSDEWLGYGWLDAIHPDDRAYAERQWREAVAARGIVDAEFRLRDPNGGWRWTNVRAAPVLDAEGKIEKWTGLNIDIDARKRAEAALREREARQRFLLTTGDAMRAETRADDKIRAAGRQLGDRLQASRVLYAEYDHAQGPAEIFNGWLAAGAEPFPATVRLKDFEGPVLDDLRAGRTVRVDDVGALIADPSFAAIANVGVQALLSVPLVVDGRLAVSLSIHQDEPRSWTDDEVALVQEIAERLWAEIVRARAEQALRESEARARLLLAELQHRVRNILAMVRSVVRRTVETGESVEQVSEHLDGRLASMARTQTMLTRSAGAGVALETLIREELLAQNAEEAAVILEGPSVELTPKAAEVLTLAVHELATNATKYGAFSQAGGTLEVRWKVESHGAGAERLRLVWREFGVSVVASAPRRIGFGTELIERRVPYELHGSGKLELAPGGLRAEIAFPLAPRESILAPRLPGRVSVKRGDV